MAQGFDKLPSWTVTIFLFGILTIAHQAAAQFHTAPWTLIGGSAPVARIDAKGTITTVIPTSAIPSNMGVLCGTVDIDDQSMVIGFVQSSSPYGDPPSGGVLLVNRGGMILKTVSTSSVQIVDLIVDDDGSYLGVGFLYRGNQKYSTPLLRISRTGLITTIHSGFNRLFQGVQVDIDSGDYRVVDNQPGVLLGIDRSGKAVTTVATLSMWSGSLRQHAGDGSLYFPNSLGQSSAPSVLRASRSGMVTTFLGTSSSLGWCTSLHWDRVSARHRRLAACVGPTSFGSGLCFIDEQTRVVTPWAAQYTYARALVPPREVASLRTAPGRWRFGLHFAGHAGKAYAMGFSLQGVRPHIPLGDGRRIQLAFDAITALSLSGRLAPILTHNLGILAPTDRAAVDLDVHALPGVAGINLYGLAVVLDPAAPRGVAIIADPIRVRL